MATREQLGLRTGDNFIFASSYKDINDNTGIRSGVPLDTDGAKVTVSIARLGEVSESESQFTVLATFTQDAFEPHYSGRRTSVSAWYRRLLREDMSGDDALRKEIEGAGIEVRQTPGPMDTVIFEVVKKSTKHNPTPEIVL